jgi:hypothetical protein
MLKYVLVIIIITTTYCILYIFFFHGTKSRDESRGDHVRLVPAFGTAFRTTERFSKQFLGFRGCYLKAGTNLPEYGFKKDFQNHKVLHRSKH